MSKKTDSLPPLPPGAPGRRAKDRYRQQYGLILICRDEGEQQAQYERLTAMGYSPRVVVT